MRMHVCTCVRLDGLSSIGRMFLFSLFLCMNQWLNSKFPTWISICVKYFKMLAVMTLHRFFSFVDVTKHFPPPVHTLPFCSPRKLIMQDTRRFPPPILLLICSVNIKFAKTLFLIKHQRYITYLYFKFILFVHIYLKTSSLFPCLIHFIILILTRVRSVEQHLCHFQVLHLWENCLSFTNTEEDWYEITIQH